ncbi:hypothetical protein SAMN05518849_12369 [Sphingobium sp. AP50]|nr:hypothetical protein SAMN05518849_12369 [Sphingobium sp. AP50]
MISWRKMRHRAAYNLDDPCAFVTKYNWPWNR